METTNIRSIQVDMTPELAKKYLDTQVHNRKCNDHWVDALCQSILRGEWIVDGNSIKMDNNGHLIDGQHRLKAVIKSGKTVQMEVRSGFSSDAIHVIDAFAKSRSLSDIATINGIPNGAAVASIIKAYYNEFIWDSKSVSWTAQRLSPTLFISYYEDRPQEWQEIAHEMNRVDLGGKNRLKLLPGSYVGGICAYLMFQKGHSKESVYGFFAQLQSVKPAQNVTIEKLRTMLIRNAVQNKRYSPDVRHSMIAKTWNAYITGKTLKRLTVKKEDARVSFI